MEKKINQVIKNKNFLAGALVFIEAVVFVLLVYSMFLPYFSVVMAEVGSPNATVVTLLQVGNVYPEILNITINGGNTSMDLNPNSTATLNVYVIARDFNNETDIQNITLRFFDTVASSYAGTPDNNNHYRNDSCSINTAYGNEYEVNATCIIPVWYYANNQTWNATARATDNASLTGDGSTTIIINKLLAFVLPDSINYSTVNATQVSSQQIANVTNAGNIMVNLSLSGYGYAVGDGNAMNCTLGSNKNISIMYEKYNLTSSNNSALTLTQFESIYTNLTSAVVTKTFNQNYRQNDTGQGFDDTNATYWRIYVPIGVAGSCRGNIVFGATQAAGS